MNSRRTVLSALALVAAIVVASLYLLPDTVVSRRRDIDEGVYLMVARLLSRGHKTSSFFFDQFWLFPKILAEVFQWFGDSLIAGRFTVFGFSLAGLIGMAILSWQSGVRWAAPVAIVLGMVEPIYLNQSRQVTADVPSTACLVWSAVLLLAFQKGGRRLWLALSGVFAAASLMIKPLAIGFVVAFFVPLVVRRLRRQPDESHFDRAGLAIDLLVFIGAGFVTAAPFIDLCHPLNEYTRTIGFHLAEGNWLATTVGGRWRALLGFSRQNVPWLAFAAIGAAALRPLPLAASVLLSGGFFSTVLLLQLPPWLHHYTLLVPVLIVFSLIGLERGCIQLKETIAEHRHGRSISHPRLSLTIMFVAALLITCVDLPWILRYNRIALRPPPDRLNAVVDFLEENTNPGDYLLSDDAMIPYLANRLIPPSAINLSFAATFKFDQASMGRLDTTLRRYPVVGIIASARYQRNPRLMSWIETNFPVSTRISTARGEALIYTNAK